MPAIRCDIDHRRDWQHGGESTVDNLSACAVTTIGSNTSLAGGTGTTYITPSDDIP
jgi:hypothetical protein